MAFTLTICPSLSGPFPQVLRPFTWLSLHQGGAMPHESSGNIHDCSLGAIVRRQRRWARGAKKCQQTYLMVLRSELLGQFKGNGATHAKSTQQIRSLRLHGNYVTGEQRGNFCNAGEGGLAGFHTGGL